MPTSEIGPTAERETESGRTPRVGSGGIHPTRNSRGLAHRRAADESHVAEFRRSAVAQTAECCGADCRADRFRPTARRHDRDTPPVGDRSRHRHLPARVAGSRCSGGSATTKTDTLVRHRREAIPRATTSNGAKLSTDSWASRSHPTSWRRYRIWVDRDARWRNRLRRSVHHLRGRRNVVVHDARDRRTRRSRTHAGDIAPSRCGADC